MRTCMLVVCLWLATSPLHAKIVFVSPRDGNFEIYKIDANGRNKTRLTRNEADEYAPVWSPDGRQIAFESYRDGNGEVYVMDADGGNQRNLTQHPAIDSYPDWHPNGTQIAFDSNRDGTSNIYAMDTDGGNVEQITHLEFASRPKWSPDGKWIAFDWSADREGTQICIINPDTTHLCRISRPAPETPMSVSGWSPDGKQLMYMAALDEARENAVVVIATLSPDGRGKVVKWEQVRLPRRLVGSPDWGADGKSILFMSEMHGNEDIYRYRLDNRKLIRLTNHPNSDGDQHEWHPPLMVSEQRLVPIPWGSIKSNFSGRTVPFLTVPR